MPKQGMGHPGSIEKQHVVTAGQAVLRVATVGLPRGNKHKVACFGKVRCILQGKTRAPVQNKPKAKLAVQVLGIGLRAVQGGANFQKRHMGRGHKALLGGGRFFFFNPHYCSCLLLLKKALYHLGLRFWSAAF